MIFRKKQKSHRRNVNDLSETPEVFLPSDEDVSKQNTSHILQSIEGKRKREIRWLIVFVGILLVVGAFLCFLIPYLKGLASSKFFITPSIILTFLMPYFWILLGWTLMQTFSVFRIVEIHHTKSSKAIYISRLYQRCSSVVRQEFYH